jgi:hypothetical protein
MKGIFDDMQPATATKPMTDEQRKANREAWEDKNLTVQIPCPEHPQDSHTATLYQFGHRYADIWECPVTGASDSHNHDDVETDIEETVQDHLGINGHYQTEHSIYVYKDCGMQADGDPAADAAEAQADYEADNWRDE